MRRRFAGVMVAAIAVLGVTSATGLAGEAGTDSDGNFLAFDADVSPPVAGTKAKPQPVTLTVHQMFGNYLSGKQPPRSTSIAVKLPKGMSVHPEFVGACPLPKSDADIKVSRCPASSRVGTGSALADARSLGASGQIPATVTAFNGEKNAAGNPTLVLFGVAKVGGQDVPSEFDFELKRATGSFGQQLVTFDPFPVTPPGPNEGYITLNKLDLKVSKTVTRKKLKRGFLEAPTSCPRAGWAFREEFALEGPSTLLAPDFVACTK